MPATTRSWQHWPGNQVSGPLTTMLSSGAQTRKALPGRPRACQRGQRRPGARASSIGSQQTRSRILQVGVAANGKPRHQDQKSAPIRRVKPFPSDRSSPPRLSLCRLSKMVKAPRASCAARKWPLLCPHLETKNKLFKATETESVTAEIQAGSRALAGISPPHFYAAFLTSHSKNETVSTVPQSSLRGQL